MTQKQTATPYTAATEQITSYIENSISVEARRNNLNRSALRKCVLSWLRAAVEYDDAMQQAADEHSAARKP